MDYDSGHLVTRRAVLKQFMAIVVLSHIPLSWACNRISENKYAVFTGHRFEMVRIIQQILFPDDGFGPGAMEIHADRYLEWVLSDERMDSEDRNYILKGFNWIDESSSEHYKKNFLQLTGEEKIKLIEKVSQTGWGESWLSIMMNYILEALLSDPQYGGNPEGKGWKWLSHYPGYPRPVPGLLYPEIFETLKKGNEQKI